MGAYVAFTNLYDSLASVDSNGQIESVGWVLSYLLIEYLVTGIAFYKASLHAESAREILVGFGFCFYKLIQSCIAIYAAIYSLNDINVFWDLANCIGSVYIMLGAGALSFFGSNIINKLIK